MGRRDARKLEMERRDGHDAGQGAVKDKDSEMRESQAVTEKLRQKGVERQMTLTIQVECQKEMKKSRRRMRSSQSRTPPPSSHLPNRSSLVKSGKKEKACLGNVKQPLPNFKAGSVSACLLVLPSKPWGSQIFSFNESADANSYLEAEFY